MATKPIDSPYDHLSSEEQEHAYAIQRLINGRTAWRLEGSYGRAMMDMINNGYCLLGREDTRDAYGNHIPSRTQVQQGTKGSYEYVANLHGEEWAAWMAAISEESST